MTLPDRIREAIATDHAAIESTPFALAMTSGKIDIDVYAAGMRELYHVHASLEASLAVALPISPEVSAAYDPTRMTRSDLITMDLSALGVLPPGEPSAVVAGFAAEIGEWATSRSWALLGPLYVLEGSRMGSMVLVRSLAPALAAECRPGNGLDYHLAGIATRPQDWQRFRSTISGLKMTDAQQADVLGAAITTMQMLVSLYADLPGEPVLADAAHV